MINYQKPSLGNKVEFSIPNNQLVLKFTSEEDAVVFHHWWYSKGEVDFIEYLKANIDFITGKRK